MRTVRRARTRYAVAGPHGARLRLIGPPLSLLIDSVGDPKLESLGATRDCDAEPLAMARNDDAARAMLNITLGGRSAPSTSGSWSLLLKPKNEPTRAIPLIPPTPAASSSILLSRALFCAPAIMRTRVAMPQSGVLPFVLRRVLLRVPEDTREPKNMLFRRLLF